MSSSGITGRRRYLQDLITLPRRNEEFLTLAEELRTLIEEHVPAQSLNTSGMIPYGKQSIDEDDIAAVVAALRSDYLTTGPESRNFRTRIRRYGGS